MTHDQPAPLADGPAIHLAGVGVDFGSVAALRGVDLTVPAGRIVGLLGRNGAGKSTLMSLLAGYRRPTRGHVHVDGADPFEHPQRTADAILVRERIPGSDSLSVRGHLEIASCFRPRWDADVAATLIERFRIPHKRRIGRLSQGQRSALGIVIGLASRAPLTMFDEPQLGLDAPSRYTFYDAMLAEYAAHPRTIVMSTHVIDEVADLFEDVVILHEGTLLVHASAESLRGRGVEVTGPVAAVDELTAGHPVQSSRQLGGTKAAVVMGHDPTLSTRAKSLGVELNPLSLQDVFVHLTESTTQLTEVRS